MARKSTSNDRKMADAFVKGMPIKTLKRALGLLGPTRGSVFGGQEKPAARAELKRRLAAKGKKGGKAKGGKGSGGDGK